jgi:hypothetical protein
LRVGREAQEIVREKLGGLRGGLNGLKSAIFLAHTSHLVEGIWRERVGELLFGLVGLSEKRENRGNNGVGFFYTGGR